MPVMKTARERSVEAVTLAQSFGLILHNHNIYMPVDSETGDHAVTPPPESRSWRSLSTEEVQRVATAQFDTLFSSMTEAMNFEYQVAQCCTLLETPVNSLLIRTPNGLRELKEDGQLHEPTGEFIPNTLPIMLNDNVAMQDQVFEIISDWLDSDEEALSLIRHLSTALAPGWSAVKYILLLGSGRNGKSVLLSMLEALFGAENTSGVSRHEMAAAAGVVTHLNGKLANIVFDGVAEYLKDSSNEKTLVAGEQIAIRKLYSNSHTPVKTNALFIEGLNQEPKSRDKSPALQARLVRYAFKNTYALDRRFHESMMEEQMLGALLALMIREYVTPDTAGAMLAPTSEAMDLQMEHIYGNSYALQFVEYVMNEATLGLDTVLDDTLEHLTDVFNAWRVKLNDYDTRSSAEVYDIFNNTFVITRRSKRQGDKTYKVKYITGLKPETEVFVTQYQGGEKHGTTVVDEG